MILPPPLRPGDTLVILPTARAIRPDELSEGIALAERWGLKVRLGSGIGRKAFQQAGTREERLTDLQQAIDDPSVRAIWCARGGYGTVHLLQGLDLTALYRHPKWIVGFSDVTALHNLLHASGLGSLHAQMPFMIGNKSEACRETLRQALFGEAYTISSPGHALDRPGTCTAPIVGGNLSVLYSLRGTPYDLDPRGKILFLEDLDELLYHTDRMVQNLRLGGWFEDIAGLIVGGMSDMHDKNPEDPFGRSAQQLIADAIGEVSYPVCYDFPAGHEADNRALVLGAKATLHVSASGSTLSVAREPAIGRIF